MSKLTKPPTSPAKDVQQVVALDDKITKLFASMAGAVRRYRAPIIISISALVAIIGIYLVFAAMKDSREEDLTARLYLLLDSQEARKNKGAVLTADLDRLVQDAKGARCERYVLKSVAQHLLERSYPPDSEFDPFAEDILKEHVESSAREDNTELLKKIEEYAQLGRERFPGDKDMETWSTGLLERIRAEREFKSKSLEKRSFRPVLPAAGAAPPSGAVPSPPGAVPGGTGQPQTPQPTGGGEPAPK